MNLAEQIKDFETYLERWWFRKQSQLWTMLPGVVNTWNLPTTGQNTVHVVPAVMGYMRMPDGTFMPQAMPEHPDVPVKYLGGGGFHMTHPIAKGDEGMICYSSRCIDGFWQNGATPTAPAAHPDYAQPTESGQRMHDLSDAFFVPTKLSDKNKLANISQTSTQIRSTDGTSYIEMLPNGGGFNFVTPNGMVHIDTNLNITTPGNITGFQGGGFVDLHHTHGGVTTGTGHTAVPDPGT